MVLYNYDSNTILTRAMKNRTKEAMIEIYKELHVILVRIGLLTHMERLYNKFSKVLLDLMENENFDFNWSQHLFIDKTRNNKRLGPDFFSWLGSVESMTDFQ